MFPFTKTWSIFPPWNIENISSSFSSMHEVFKLEGSIISKSDQSEIFAHEVNEKTFFVKRYFKTKGLGSWFGFSRLQLEVRNQLLFNQLNIPAARVVAYGTEQFFLKPKKGAIITEGIENVSDLAVIANQHPEKFHNATWCRALTSQAAQLLKTLHKNKFCHNDMHWRNILVQENEEKNKLKIFLIDCPSGKYFFWPFLQYKILKDLANIDKFAPQYLSRTQRLRFFFEYRQISTLATVDKTMIMDILKHKSNRLKRKAREKNKGSKSN